MASMELVELVPPAKVARELATQVAGVMTDGSTAEGRARVKEFFAQCKGHVMNQDACGFVGAVLSAAGDDLMAFPKRRGASVASTLHALANVVLLRGCGCVYRL